jgi:hypothetical protein
MASFINEEEREEETSQKSTESVKLTKFCEFIPEKIWSSLEKLLILKTKMEDEERKQIIANRNVNLNVSDVKSVKTSEYFLSDQNRNFAEQISFQCEPSADFDYMDDENDKFIAELDIDLLGENYNDSPKNS